jgi:hypothetical protein
MIQLARIRAETIPTEVRGRSIMERCAYTGKNEDWTRFPHGMKKRPLAKEGPFYEIAALYYQLLVRRGAGW